MRELTEHKVNPANDVLRVQVTDQIGAGGANHRYVVTGYDPTKNPSFSTDQPPGVQDNRHGTSILFQNGPIGTAGPNGMTQEVLLAIVADRLRSFQAGPFACEENADALKHVAAAQAILHARTKARMERGVEGTHKI